MYVNRDCDFVDGLDAASAISVDPSARGRQLRQRADKFVKLSARRSDNLTGG